MVGCYVDGLGWHMAVYLRDKTEVMPIYEITYTKEGIEEERKVPITASSDRDARGKFNRANKNCVIKEVRRILENLLDKDKYPFWF